MAAGIAFVVSPLGPDALAARRRSPGTDGPTRPPAGRGRAPRVVVPRVPELRVRVTRQAQLSPHEFVVRAIHSTAMVFRVIGPFSAWRHTTGTAFTPWVEANGTAVFPAGLVQLRTVEPGLEGVEFFAASARDYFDLHVTGLKSGRELAAGMLLSDQVWTPHAIEETVRLAPADAAVLQGSLEPIRQFALSTSILEKPHRDAFTGGSLRVTPLQTAAIDIDHPTGAMMAEFDPEVPVFRLTRTLSGTFQHSFHLGNDTALSLQLTLVPADD